MTIREMTVRKFMDGALLDMPIIELVIDSALMVIILLTCFVIIRGLWVIAKDLMDWF